MSTASLTEQLQSIVSSLDASTVQKRRLAWEQLQLFTKNLHRDDSLLDSGISIKSWSKLLCQDLPDRLDAMLERQKSRKTHDLAHYAGIFANIVDDLVVEEAGLFSTRDMDEWGGISSYGGFGGGGVGAGVTPPNDSSLSLALMHQSASLSLSPKYMKPLFTHIQKILSDSDFALRHMGAPYCSVFRRLVSVQEYATRIDETLFKKLFSTFLNVVLTQESQGAIRSSCASCLNSLLRTYVWDIPRKLSKSILNNFHTTFTSLHDNAPSLILPLIQAFNAFLERRLLYLMGTYRKVFKDILDFLCSTWSGTVNNFPLRVEMCKLFQMSLRNKFHRSEIPMDVEDLTKLVNEMRRGLNQFAFVSSFSEYQTLLHEEGTSHYKIFFNLAADVFYHMWYLENTSTIGHSRTNPSVQPQKRQKLTPITEKIAEGLNALNRHTENWLYMLDHLTLLYTDCCIDGNILEALFGILESDQSSQIAKDIALRIFTNVVHPHLDIDARQKLYTYAVRVITTETQSLIDNAFLLLARIIFHGHGIIAADEDKFDWNLSQILRSEHFFSASSTNTSSPGSMLFLLAVFQNSKATTASQLDENSVETYTEWLMSSFTHDVAVRGSSPHDAPFNNLKVSVDSFLAHDSTRKNKRWHMEVFDTLSLVYNPLHTMAQKMHQEKSNSHNDLGAQRGSPQPLSTTQFSVNDSLFNDSLNDSSISQLYTSHLSSGVSGNNKNHSASSPSNGAVFKLTSENALSSAFDLNTFPPNDASSSTSQQLSAGNRRRTPTKREDSCALHNAQYSVNMALFASNMLAFEKRLLVPPALLSSIRSLLSRALQYISVLLDEHKSVDSAIGVLRIALPLFQHLSQNQNAISLRPSHEAQISSILTKASQLTTTVATQLSAKKIPQRNTSFLLVDTSEEATNIDHNEGFSMLNFLMDFFSLLGNLIDTSSEATRLNDVVAKQFFQDNCVFKIRVADTLVCMGQYGDSLKLFVSRTKIANFPEAQNLLMRALIRFLDMCPHERLISDCASIGDVIKVFVNLWHKGVLSERLRLTLCKLLIATFKHDNLLSDLFSEFFDFVHDLDYPVRLEAFSFIAQLVATYEDPVLVFNDISSEIQSDTGSRGDMDDLTPRSYLVALTYFACEPMLEKSAVIQIVQARMQPQGNVPSDFYDYLSQFIANTMNYRHAHEVYSAHIEDIVYGALTEEDSPIEINNLPVRLFAPHDDFRKFFTQHAHRIIPLIICLKKHDVLERIANSMQTPVVTLLKEHFASVYAYCHMAQTTIPNSFSLLTQHVNQNELIKLARASMTEIISSMLHFMRIGESLPFFSRDAAQTAIQSFASDMNFHSLDDVVSQSPVELFMITTHLLSALQSSHREMEVRHVCDQISLILDNISSQLMNDPFALRALLHLVSQMADKREGLVRACELLQKIVRTVATPLTEQTRDVLASQLNTVICAASQHISQIQRPYFVVEVFVETLNRFQSDLFHSFGLSVPQHEHFAKVKQTYDRYFSSDDQIKRIQHIVRTDDISAIIHLAQYLSTHTEGAQAILDPQHNELLSEFVKKLSKVIKGHYDVSVKKSASDILGRLGLAVYSQTRSDAIPEAYDEYEFVAAPLSFRDWTKEKVRQYYHVKLLELLAKYLIDSDINVVKTATHTIKRLLGTTEGQDALKELDPQSRLFVDPFQGKTSGIIAALDNAVSLTQNIPTLDECFRAKGHRKWVREVTFALIKLNHIKDPFLNMCDGITRLKGRFAELVWIVGLYDIAIWQTSSAHLLINLEDLIKAHIVLNPNAPPKSIRLVLFSLSMLFKQTRFDFARMPKVPNTDRPDYVLRIPSIYLAKAAFRARAVFSALHFIEQSMEKKRESIKLSHQDIIFEEDQKPEEALLLDIYTKIDEPDGIYGITDVYAPKSHILRAEHEENWTDALSSYDSLLQENTSEYNTLSKSRQHSGLLHSVQNLGHEHLASSYSIFLLQNRPNEIDKHLHESIFESAWRQESWYNDKVFSELNVQGFHHAIFKSLQCIQHQQYGAVQSYLSIAQQEVQTNFSSNFFPTLIQYQMVADIQLVAAFLHNESDSPSTMDLISKLSDTSMLRNHSFTSFEPLLTLRHTLLKLMKRPELTVQLACHTVSFARKQGHINYAKNLIHNMNLNHKNQDIAPYWLYEESKVLWRKGEKHRAINLMRFFVRMAEGRHASDPSISSKMGLALKSLGKWLGSTRSESVEAVRDLMNRALKLCNDVSSAYYAIAKFEDSLYKSCERKFKSEENEVQNRIRKENQEKLTQFAAYMKQNRKNSDIRRAYNILEKVVAQEKQRTTDLEQRTKQYLQNALSNYGEAAKSGNAHNMETVFRFVSLWLKYPEDQDLNAVFWNLGKTVPPYKYIPLVYQIASRLASSGNVKFNAVVQHILVLIASHSPQHSLYQLFALKNGGLRADTDSFTPDKNRISAASSVISHLAKNNFRILVDQMSALIAAYVELAYYPIPEKYKRAKSVPLKKTLKLRLVSNLTAVHVPTKELPVDPKGQYADVMTHIVSFDSNFATAGGVNLPKIIKCNGSDNKAHRQLVKGNDDLRQDAVMQQLFDVVNNLLQNHQETRRRKLRVRTYKVIPLSPRSGILGWVENTIPLAEYLIGENDAPLNCAHVRYRPQDELHSKCRNLINIAAKTGNFQEKLSAYQQVCRCFKPVFHHFFMERFPDAHDWYLKRLSYTRSVAASSIVGYIIGLGDRHVYNILLDVESAEVVHIDLGVAFDQGLLLPIPETIPFRLTRDIEDGFGISGVEGVFRRCCVSTMAILRQNLDLLYTIVEVLLHDPLYNWSIDPIKGMNVQRIRGDQRISRSVNQNAAQENEVKNRDAGRVLIRFTEKLQGYEDNELLGVEGHVNKLINQARSEENLCALFHGWSAFL
eukprot:CAMPEP_0117435454 /NCGR_PEP_ID=MMETSP0759-20121206/490_1 /TAXON_ID=63605 /ORGANISM="Percolomonas cosmopolitus, Strain WS" /LENGTH=2884 /DNA_ID=CAMNT_0005227003 /DNA_START=126 /DNA_END=8781 /DNA_ORIENTATION=+